MVRCNWHSILLNSVKQWANIPFKDLKDSQNTKELAHSLWEGQIAQSLVLKQIYCAEKQKRLQVILLCVLAHINNQIIVAIN